METEVAEKQSSYRYWVRETREDAASLPVPRKLTEEDMSKQPQSNVLGSVWNQAGTWEEKNLNSWASSRIKELLTSLSSVQFANGKADITEVTKCSGDAFLVTVRNKKRVGYTYELTLKFKGEWKVKEDQKKVKGHLDIPEFSFGELEDLQVDVRLSDDKDLIHEEKEQIARDVKLFLSPIREKLEQFESELKDRYNSSIPISLALLSKDVLVPIFFSLGLARLKNKLQEAFTDASPDAAKPGKRGSQSLVLTILTNPPLEPLVFFACVDRQSRTAEVMDRRRPNIHSGRDHRSTQAEENGEVAGVWIS
ncbi:hypothetical protein H6P81_010116 [Aristolochia fimbriata]|uniref:Activator of Hsp90 ATPase AHSA1-like N-terminal domain-containing protein n=1 Tax=Aristolochia fimbriata TaxID=158543 RepID=A0AAV7ER80_ARIFI|nr:hypothetical protein H6P81_010116 [Aristolochia fimbriata]